VEDFDQSLDVDEEVAVNLPRIDQPTNRNDINRNQTTSDAYFKFTLKRRSKSVGSKNQDRHQGTPKIIYKYIFKNAESKLFMERGN